MGFPSSITYSLFTKLIFWYFIATDTKCLSASSSSNGVIDPLNKEIFRILTNSPIYKKHVPPQELQPIRVNLSMYLLDFGSVTESATSFDLHLLLRFAWFDERLRPWNATIRRNQSVAILEGGSWHLDRLWTPDLHVPNSKTPNILADSSQNLVLTRVQSDGRILVSKRIIINGISQMDFRLYPLDVQAIDFEIESNELSYNNLQLAWKEIEPFNMNEHFHWNGYEMYRYELLSEVANYSQLGTGTFSKLIARLHLRRNFGWQFIIEVYAPIVLYVIISWAAFWIDIKESGARISLCMTIILTMVTTSQNARKDLPVVDYISALDVWITVSTVFVIASLVEHMTANYVFFREKRAASKLNKRKRSLWQRETYAKKFGNLKGRATPETGFSDFITDDKTKTFFYFSISGCCCLNFHTDKPKKERKLQVDGSVELAYEIDRKSRIAFPSLFLAFNAVYWLVVGVEARRVL